MPRDLFRLKKLGLGCDPASAVAEDYNPNWKILFAEESELLSANLNITDFLFYHIGGTSVEGLCAKPLIDIMGVVSDFREFDNKGDIINSLGYIPIGYTGGSRKRNFILSDPNGKLNFFRLHVYLKNSVEIDRHLELKDFFDKQREQLNRAWLK